MEGAKKLASPPCWAVMEVKLSEVDDRVRTGGADDMRNDSIGTDR